MAEDTTTQCSLFSDLCAPPVVMQFDQRQGSSDGGAILLKAADRRLGLTRALAACLEDRRQTGKVEHALHELLTPRVMAIACGYEDANDAARLAADPVHKLLVGRDPIAGADLASQPTLSRFENAPDRKQRARLAEALAAVVIERHRRRLKGRARRITIDLDPTDDPTHGAQQWALFNGHYATWCYLPLLGFLSFNDEPEQYLFPAVLCSGKAAAWQGARGVLRRLLKKLRRAFPRVRMRIRRAPPAGFSGRATGRGIRRGDGQKCGVEAEGEAPHASGATTFAAHGKDRTRLRGSRLCRPHLVASAPHRHQSRSRPPGRPRPQG